jgi:DNA polymerase-3 subunit delta'
LYKNYSVQFKEIIGHSSLKNKLLNIAQSGRISHTQLFLGPEGSGNLALALAFAQYVNCTQPGTEDSCGNCSSCIKYQQIIHPDLHFTYPFTSPTKLSKELIEEWRAAMIDNPYISDFDWLQKINNEANKQLNITAEECRAVISGLGLKSYEAKYKVHVIWQPEYLSKEGNILLKLLEEPPPFTLILLVGNNTEKILPTILSRAQLVKVPKITDADLIDALIAKYSMEEQKARDTARLADGNFNRAKSLIDIDHEGYFTLFSDWMRSCYGQKMLELQPMVDTLSAGGREYIKNFLHYAGQMIRSAFIYRYAKQDLLKVNQTELAFLLKFSPFLHDQNLAEITKSLDDATYHVERNANLKILFLNLSLYIGKQLKTAQK